jgi:hypothetical protein
MHKRGNVNRFLAEVTIFSFSKTHTLGVGPTHLPIQEETGGLSPGVKWPGLKLSGAILPLLLITLWRAHGHDLFKQCYLYDTYAIFTKSVYLNKI